MSELEFVENLLKNLEKNGYPLKKVAFPLDRLYESAYLKGLNFNKVLEALKLKGVDHEKTSTKVIFYPENSDAPIEPVDLPANLAEMMEKAKDMLKNLSPTQMDEVKKMVMNLSPQEREDLMKKAQAFGKDLP